jgi:regulator of CtrA degradation
MTASFAMPFIERIYDEAKALLVEARDYMQTLAPAERATMTPLENLHSISEGLRLTTRLTEVMAWAMTHKAVQAGEISREEAAQPHRRLGGQSICLEEVTAGMFEPPPRLVSLLRRSLSLYQRTLRLDRLMAGEEMQFGSFNICLASGADAGPTPPEDPPRVVLA